MNSDAEHFSMHVGIFITPPTWKVAGEEKSLVFSAMLIVNSFSRGVSSENVPFFDLVSKNHTGSVVYVVFYYVPFRSSNPSCNTRPCMSPDRRARKLI